jgi:hypothetical protein
MQIYKNYNLDLNIINYYGALQTTSVALTLSALLQYRQ